jgi:hypothetical protein
VRDGGGHDEQQREGDLPELAAIHRARVVDRRGPARRQSPMQQTVA